MFKNMMASPKTTFLGFASIVAVVAKWVQSGHIDLTDLQSIVGIVSGLGLMSAKDANVTGVK